MSNLMWDKLKPAAIQLSLFAVIGLVAWFGIRLLLSTIQTKMDVIQQHAVTREYRERQLDKLPELEAQHALIAQHADSLGIILTKDRLIGFIEALERVARDEGVKIKIESRENAFLESKVTVIEKKANPSNPAPASDTKGEDQGGTEKKKASAAKETGIITELPLKKYLRLTISLSGEYKNIVRYVHRLESLPYALDIIGMDLRVKPEEVVNAVPESGALNPFDATLVPAPSQTERPESNILDATFETIMYMND
jgi:Tfp pilus assembly protein PilO